jgi:hypothetical protein
MKLRIKAASKNFRAVMGLEKLDATLQKIRVIFKKEQIGSILIGGIALQHYGYERSTKDIDLVVKDYLKVVRLLISKYGFAPDAKGAFIVIDSNGVRVDLLPSGLAIEGNQVAFPSVTTTDSEILPLNRLINLKLDSYESKQLHRGQDKADVIKLIQINNLKRDFLSGLFMEPLYQQLWDKLNLDPEKPIKFEESI